MPLTYFSKIFPRLQERLRYAVPSTLPLSNDSLRRCLDAMLSGAPGDEGSLVSDPAFEAMFGWKYADVTMADLVGSIVDAQLASCLNEPPEELRQDYAFPFSRRPYTHQLEAWKILCGEEPTSAVISSGTGSGKTECFMIPILNRLSRQSATQGAPLEGIRALFLYPLNALISSQRDRLDAWTRGFNGNVRFCLYNGKTPESLPAHEKRYPNEIRSREDLRSSPPPILFTNATMLEYMLVRTEDAPILKKSQGTLEWIVLDEAHCYIGSQAAELSLLLRRVQRAFGVHSDNVRFVATSATIGDPDGPNGLELKRFLSDVAGVPLSRVSLITGERNIPVLPAAEEKPIVLEKLESINPETPKSAPRYENLCHSKTARAVRTLFTANKNVARLSEVQDLLKSYEEPADPNSALRWLDVLSWTTNSDGAAFLPLRAHIFARGLPGLWSCADANCPHKQKELHEDWPYGAVWSEMRTHCTCGSPVFEIVTCRGCRTPFLLAKKNDSTDSSGRPAEFLTQKIHSVDPDEEDDIVIDEDQVTNRIVDSYTVLLVPHGDSQKPLFLDKESSRLLDADEGNAIQISLEYPKNLDGSLSCPLCLEPSRQERDFYYYNRIGTPYLQNAITQTLLEFAPDGKNPLQHPYRGRKILTFNDSRQGTARSAMRMQLFSELSRIRSLLHHIGLQECRSGNHEERHKLEQLIDKLSQAQSSTPNAILEGVLNDKKNELASLGGLAPISFNDMAEKLQTERSTFEVLLRNYQDKFPTLFSGGSGTSDFARMLIFREFGRRPTKAINLETLGLMAVCYPALEQVSSIPLELQHRNCTLHDWKNFLKICLDFVFRANGATDFPREWRKWLGMTYTQKFLLPPYATEHSKIQLIWPRCRHARQHRLVRLLERALNLNSQNLSDGDIIDSILNQAWSALTSINICTSHSDGTLLRHSAISFAPLQKAYLCPFTRRFLDTTFLGISPYLPRKGEQIAPCREYEIPLYPSPFSAISETGIQETRDWLSENEAVHTLRKAGLWFFDHDSVVELTPYFRAQEHSAQLPSVELEMWTQKFREGEINVLSCSTTMEMGIDIGGISIVGMNNVPPHPANYLQRSGRSGRRGETRALTFTMCKDNPHEMAAFSNSRWAFDTTISVPRVSLNSLVIMQRHVNALLLTAFLKQRQQQNDKDLTKLSCEAFFTGEPKAVAELFSQRFRTLSADSPLLDDIRFLCSNSMFQHERPEAMAEKAAEAMERAYKRWHDDFDALCREEQNMQKDRDQENSAAMKAVTLRKSRMANEYLLKELISLEFLPAHGFPLHVATFDTMNLTHFRENRRKKDNKGEDNNLFLRRELPSRSLSSALTEYAPGNCVAINGLVYESNGITLNWHIPASEDAATELQNIRSRWRCRKCGSFGTAANRSPVACSNCGAPLSKESWHEYLEPAGFATDFFKEPSNNAIVGMAALNPAEANVCAYGEWITLGLPEAVRFRCTTSGIVFHLSRGLYGNGYAVCLACGRVESISKMGEVPSSMKNHKKLRGGKYENDPPNHICPACRAGMDWKIKAPLWLASESKTDVMELQIRKEDNTWLNDEKQAFPIAVALRDALAARLGIQMEELECTVDTRRQEDGTLCSSIFIFDKNAAGYASSAAEYITELLLDAQERLLCRSHGCETACPHCILSFDLRYQSRDLDRHQGLEVLTPTWFAMLDLPPQARIFGTSTAAETMRLEESVLSASLQYPKSTILLHLGSHSLWLPGDAGMLHLLDILRLRQAHVELALEKELYDSFSKEERMLLAPLIHGNVTCSVLEGGFSHPHTRLAVTIIDDGQLYRWAVYEEEENCLLLKGCSDADLGTRKQLTQRDLQVKSGNSVIVPISSNDKTSIPCFGAWLWEKLCRALRNSLEVDPIASKLPIARIIFSDRYCNSPLTVALFYRLLNHLKELYGKAWTSPDLFIMLSDRITGEYPNVWDNWNRATDRNEAMRALLNELGAAKIIPMDKKMMAHARKLQLDFRDGTALTIWLDQGLGFLRVDPKCSDRHFPFHDTYEEQIIKLKNMHQNLIVTQGGTIVSMQLSKI